MEHLINVYKKESSNVFNSIDNQDIMKFVNCILLAYKNNNKIFACGNGGNAAFVCNLITDLNLHPFVSEDKNKPIIVNKRLFAINLTESGSTITGILNDFGGDYIFSEQLKYSAKNEDVFIGITGSGSSKNIIEALKVAKEIGMKKVVITKNKNSICSSMSDIVIEIVGTSIFPGQIGKNNNNFHFEDCISKLSHIATGILKQEVQNENMSI